MELRPYQHEAVEAIYRHLRERDDNPCVVIPTGGGKTPVMATVCRDAVGRWNGRVLILAHVKELLDQAREKLHQMAPEMWMKTGVYSAGLKRRDTEHPIIIAGIQSVYKRACELDAFNLVIIDECFVAGTLISTPSGDLPIEHVLPGMFVCNATGIGRVSAISAKKVTNIITLEYSDGTKISCTPNHPIFTESGWRKAGSLEIGSLAFGVETLRMLQERVSPVGQTSSGWNSESAKRAALDDPAFLFEVLREDSGKSHETGRGTESGRQDHEIEGLCSEGSGRQWTTDRAARKDARNLGKGLGCGIFDPHKRPQKETLAESPENRFSESVIDDCDRAGWAKPQNDRSKRDRCQKDDVPCAKRLVRISHYKPAGEHVVFNLQIEGHPSYFANGILAHNCHMIPPEGDGMYRTFLNDARKVNPNLRVIGLTATPFRTTSGLICAPDNILNHVCYEVGVRELIVQGYLCPLVTKAAREKIDTSSLHVRAGEFISGEVEDLMDTDNLVEAACREIVEKTRDRKAVLIFAAGVRHGEHIAEVLRAKYGAEVGTVFGDTLDFVRDRMISDFKAEKLKYLVNVNVLTMGFDAPNIDCVVMVRPTLSPGLYYQMVGRGFRLHEGKKDCLVLDFGGNVLRHGPVDAIRIKTSVADGDEEAAPAKECPQCRSVIAAGYATCPDCGYDFPPRKERTHDAVASGADILSGQVTTTECAVQETFYAVHRKKGAQDTAPKTMRVDYRIGFHLYQSEWICFEHDGFARVKAEGWWERRSDLPCPNSAAEAVELAEAGSLAKTKSITVRSVSGEEFPTIIRHELGPKPECFVNLAGLAMKEQMRSGEYEQELDDVPF